MPAYRNDTDRRITHRDMNYLDWMPGETRDLPFYVPHEELGLTKVSDLPAPRRPVYDWTVTLTPHDPAVLDLPYFEVFELSVYVLTGSADVYVGDGDAPIGVSDTESHFGVYGYARCPRLKFVSAGDALLHVKQEERNVRHISGRGDAR